MQMAATMVDWLACSTVRLSAESSGEKTAAQTVVRTESQWAGWMADWMEQTKAVRKVLQKAELKESLRVGLTARRKADCLARSMAEMWDSNLAAQKDFLSAERMARTKAVRKVAYLAAKSGCQKAVRTVQNWAALSAGHWVRNWAAQKAA